MEEKTVNPTYSTSDPGAGKKLKGSSDAESYRSKANHLLNSGRYRQACLFFEKAVKLDKSNYRDFLGMGLALSGGGQRQKALEYFEKAFALQPGDPEVCTNLIITQLILNKVRAALAVLKNSRSEIPYGVATEVVRRVALSQVLVRIPAVKSMAESFRQLLSYLEIPMDPALLATHTFANLLLPVVPWKEKALDRCSDQELERWIFWDGLESLQKYSETGRGVILLHGHLVGQHVAALGLVRKGFKMYSMQVGNRQANFGVTASKAINVIEVPEGADFLLKQVYKAQKALKSGGVLQMAGDGNYGRSGVTVPFLGSSREFKTGFAELALNTNTPVLPLFTSINLSGQITVNILPELGPGDEHMDRTARVESMVRQFAACLEGWWRTHPSDITHYTVARFVAQAGLTEAGKNA